MRLLPALRGLAVILPIAFTAGRSSAAPPVVFPPVIERSPTITDEADVETSVEIELTVLTTGAVQDVRVVSAPAPRFDEIAQRLMSTATFSPATRDGTPIRARIRYVVVFPARVANLRRARSHASADGND